MRIAVAMGGDGNAAAQVASSELKARGITDIVVEVATGPPGVSSLSLSALDIAHRLVADPAVLAVVGHSNSEASLAASAVYNQAGVVQIAPTSTATEYHQAGEYSFRLVPDDGRQVEFILQFVRQGRSTSRVAVAFVNDEYGRSLYYRTRDAFKSAGHNLIHEVAYVAGADSAAMALIGMDVARARPDVLLWFGRAPELAPALKALRAAGPDVAVVASDGVDTPALYANRGGRYTGLTFVRLIDATAASRRAPEFDARFHQRMRRAPSTEAVLTYDAVMLLVAAIRSGADDRPALRQRISEYGGARAAFNGISGAVAFNADGDVIRPHQLAQVTPEGVRAVHMGVEQH